MCATVTRKCKACKNEIEININKISDVVYYKKLYYHSSCFCELAKKRSQSKSKSAPEWENALGHIKEFEEKAKNILTYCIPKDILNEYLLSQYNVVSIEKRFWQTLADLNDGFYRCKRCKKVSTIIIYETWEWMQSKLDDINRYNKANNKGPSDGMQRINYDFSIVVKKVPDYLAYKAKQEAAEIERQESMKENIKIDYSSISTNPKKEQEDDIDISSLIDDIF